MKLGWTTVTLGEVADIERRGVDPASLAADTAYLGLEHIESGGRIIGRSTVGDSAIASTKFRFGPEHVLFGKLRPYLAKIAAPDFNGVCSTDILPIRPKPVLDASYLAHFLRQPVVVDLASARATGANLPRLSPAELAKFELPLPPIEEQRRIAAILDHVDALRGRRRRSVALLTSLTSASVQSAVERGRPDYVSLGELTTSLRNGLSPSSKGHVAGRVLTLSAVTRGGFDPSAAKDAWFDKAADNAQRVSADTLLICRGNGNRQLVGAGEMPSDDHPELIYPDTVIAATVDSTKVEPRYLWAVWRLPSVRAAVQASAKTTNGIHKVNQGGLSSIRLPVLPRDQQRCLLTSWGGCVASGDRFRASGNYLDGLFSTLRARAFSGRL